MHRSSNGDHMQSTKMVAALGIVFLLAVVANGQSVKFDYDHSIDFSRFKTFMLSLEPLTNDPLLKKEITDTIDAQLSNRGLTPVKEGADLAVAATYNIEERYTWPTNYNRPGSGWPGFPVTTVETYELGTLTVRLFDAHTKKLVWQATATEEAPAEMERRTEEIGQQIDRIFRNFPPATTK